MANENNDPSHDGQEDLNRQYYENSMSRSAPANAPDTQPSAKELAYTNHPGYINTHRQLDRWREKRDQEQAERHEGVQLDTGRTSQRLDQEMNNFESNAAIISEIEKTREKINKVAKVADTAINLPILKHVGLDSILGMFGMDFSTLIIGSYIAYQGRKQGLPKKDIGKILAHMGADWLLGNIPGLGLFADFIYKSNKKGAEIFEDYAERRIAELQAQDRSSARMNRRRRTRHH